MSTDHCTGWWWFHTGVGCVLMAWVRSNGLDTSLTVSLLADHLQPFMDPMYPHNYRIFQQDDALCHEAQVVQNWFEDHRGEF